jgi:hypothetical protein
VPAELGALTRLETLDLSNCSGLRAVPAELRALTRLETLDLSNCSGLWALPAELWALTGLRKLNMRGCSGLTALPAELGALARLLQLYLFKCSRLAAMPTQLGALTRLEVLDLDCYRLSALPTELGALKRLRELNPSNWNQLTALPAELGALTGLQKLVLSDCSRLTALPAEHGALTGLQKLNLDKCPALHTPPPRVVAAGTGAVLAFLRDLGGGSAPCHLVKLVLLGEQRAGKSSLADSLLRGRPSTRPADDRTVGINVCRWWLGAGQGKGANHKKDDPNEELVAHIFDAAGHRVYRATHGAFMSANALFLHVVRSYKSEEAAAAAVLRFLSGWRRCSRRRPAR